MRYHEALREAVRYINSQYRGPEAKAAGRNIGREGKRWVAAQTATMIQQEMLGDGVTKQEITDFIDDCAQLFLEEQNDD